MARVNRNAGIEAARIAGESAAMDAAAKKTLTRARASAAKHANTGAYMASLATGRIKGKKGVTDREVYSDDPAALEIELGHFATRKDGSPGRFVPGQFNLVRASKGL